MRRRGFIRLCATGLGPLALGCQGHFWYEERTPVSPEPTSPDAGAPLELLPAHDAAPLDSDAGPGGSSGFGDAGTDAGSPAPRAPDASTPGAFDAGTEEACPMPRTVTLHDTHAQALYFDGTHGPTTGIVHVDDIVRGAALDLEFWHGHGGVTHRFFISSSELAALSRGERVTVETTEVDGHRHLLFIDPIGESWRAGPDRTVELCD